MFSLFSCVSRWMYLVLFMVKLVRMFFSVYWCRVCMVISSSLGLVISFFFCFLVRCEGIGCLVIIMCVRLLIWMFSRV